MKKSINNYHTKILETIGNTKTLANDLLKEQKGKTDNTKFNIFKRNVKNLSLDVKKQNDK